MTGAEPVSFRWVNVGLENEKYSEEAKPSFHHNDVTMNYTVSTRRTRNETITGALRLQYQFLIPKYPIGTFSIYSCLGNTKFSAKPAR